MSGTSEIAPARPGKSPAAFRTISEVAEDLDLPPHVLRFWESKFPQLQPLKRGGGRRYYRPEDIRLLRHIRQCLYQDGYTIRGVQKLLGSPGDARPPESGRPILPATMPTLFPLDAADHDPSTDRPPGAAEEQPAPEKPARRPRRRPTGPSDGDPERRAVLAEIRRELLEARAALAELLGPPKPR